MSSYTPSTNFAAKDALSSGNPAKIIKGTEFSAEFTAIQAAVNSKLDSADISSYETITNVQNSSSTSLSSVAGTNTITASVTPSLVAYATNQVFQFIASGTNTGATTININSLGAKSIKVGTTELAAGSLISGNAYAIQYDGTQFQLINAVTGSLTGVTSINGGQFSLRNKLINGAFGIDQRNAGAAQTITAAAALAYTVDRWYGYCTGANVTGQRVAGTAPNQYNYRFTGAASVTKIGFAQRIEAANCQDLAGTTATLAVDLANSLLTTVTWTAWYANTADTFGTLASPTRTQIATGTFTVSSTLTRYSTNITIPSAATTGIEIEFSVAAQTSGTWTIGRAQLEVGSAATAFEVRPYGMELALAQRYYYRFSPTAGQAMAIGLNNTTVSGIPYIQFPVSMRTTPTSMEVSGTAADYQIRHKAGTVTACSAVPTISAQSTIGAKLVTTVAAGLTAGECSILEGGNTTAILGFPAEL